jgi:alkylation response protein AidB-like acyl-CoA dehydrogenase
VPLQVEAKKQGLWALGHPTEVGGQGMPFRDYIYVNEVQGRSALASQCLGTHSLQDSLMLLNHASAELQDRYLHKLVQADIYPSFAMTEPDLISSDPTGIQTMAAVDDATQEWVINGRKWWTSGAEQAAYTCVMVRTEFGSDTPIHGSFSIILVPTTTPGYIIERGTHVLGDHGAHSHNEVKYDNVRVPLSNLIGKRGGGFLIAQERLGPGRIFHCMRWIGQAQRAFDLMCERLVDRKLPTRQAEMTGGAETVLGDKQLMKQHVFDSFW